MLLGHRVFYRSDIRALSVSGIKIRCHVTSGTVTSGTITSGTVNSGTVTSGTVTSGTVTKPNPNPPNSNYSGTDGSGSEVQEVNVPEVTGHLKIRRHKNSNLSYCSGLARETSALPFARTRSDVVC